jgi:putative lipoic acid-binding regulatory protein
MNNKEKLILDDTCKTRPDIDYPSTWNYKLIGRDLDKLVTCVKVIMKETNDKKHTCTQGNVSKTGKFNSYNTSCTVESEEERNAIFKYFSEHSDVDMVI